MWFGISLWLTWSAGLVVSSPTILLTLSLLVRGRILEWQHRCCVRDPHQYCFIINTFLATNAKCSPARADVRKINWTLGHVQVHLLSIKIIFMSWLCLDVLEASCLG